MYTLVVSDSTGIISRVFGVRRLVADGLKMKLNGYPYYLRGACEHLYIPDTIHPNHNEEYYRNIIIKLKEFGFNFLCFHTYIPEEEFMKAADELGILLHVENPNNTTEKEWEEIVKFCRHHTSVVIYCCGNELLIDEPFIEHLRVCANAVHNGTDALFSPMSALRGIEYGWKDENFGDCLEYEPFKHNPKRFEKILEFSDIFTSYAQGDFSYCSLKGNAQILDSWSSVYKKPRLSHEICIDGTYADLRVKDRYTNSRMNKTEMFSSLEEHLKEKGVYHKANMFFENSCQWQKRIRKYCFETIRLADTVSGFDFLGPIDTHWHTYGYECGMMNEFYELKPGVTVRDVLMYNSETVLLNDLYKKVNYTSCENVKCGIFASHYGKQTLLDAKLKIKLKTDDDTIYNNEICIDKIENGKVSKIYDVDIKLPEVTKPEKMMLDVSLKGIDVSCENEWELYIFPESETEDTGNLVVIEKATKDELEAYLKDGKRVILFGTEPFKSFNTSFRISLPGRGSDNLSTAIYKHPVLDDIVHDGYIGWQFASLMEGGRAVCFESDDVPFNTAIEVASPHKYVVRQSSFFEYNMYNGKLLVCSMNFNCDDPAAKWLKAKLIKYAKSDEFNPEFTLTKGQYDLLMNAEVKEAESNKNFAFNINDKAAIRRKK